MQLRAYVLPMSFFTLSSVECFISIEILLVLRVNPRSEAILSLQGSTDFPCMVPGNRNNTMVQEFLQ
jgi:hypothetical protein